MFFKDKNKNNLASITFQTQATLNDIPYNTLGFIHEGNSRYDVKHSVLFRQDERGKWGVLPDPTSSITLGKGGYLWSQVYTSTASISTSDEREKDNIANPSQDLINAWGSIGFKVFQFKDALEQKGHTKARIHIGVIAQEIDMAFKARGLDASRYGLFCHDAWDDEFETLIVEDAPSIYDINGNVLKEAITHTERKKIKKAGDRYGIRYEEALILECAYLRSCIKKMQEQITQIMETISKLTTS